MEINTKIRKCNPDAQILNEDFNSSLKQGFDKNKSVISDTASQYSMPISGISRRSDYTTITLKNPSI